jgi:hypothetical protein
VKPQRRTAEHRAILARHPYRSGAARDERKSDHCALLSTDLAMAIRTSGNGSGVAAARFFPTRGRSSPDDT